MNDLILARQHCNCKASYTLIIDCSIAHKLIASLGDLVMVVRCALILGDLPRLDPGDWPRRAVRDFYLRQLRDWKGSADIDTMSPSVMTIMRASAQQPSPAPTPARATGLPSRPTWATAMSSTGPAPTSPVPMPTRTSVTTKPLPKPWTLAGLRHRLVSKEGTNQ
jgi:hypothetical protein